MCRKPAAMHQESHRLDVRTSDRRRTRRTIEITEVISESVAVSTDGEVFVLLGRSSELRNGAVAGVSHTAGVVDDATTGRDADPFPLTGPCVWRAETPPSATRGGAGAGAGAGAGVLRALLSSPSFRTCISF